MRRVIAAASLVAVVALLPLLVGLSLQHRHQRIVAGLGERGYRVAEAAYQLGWLRSSLRTEIAPAAATEGEQSRLRLVLRLRHGPEVWLRDWPPVLATADGRVSVLGAPRALPPLVVAARLSPGGALDATLRVPDVTYSGEAGRLHFVSGDAELRLARDGAWRLHGRLASLEATAPEGRRLRLVDMDWQLAAADQTLTLALPLSRLSLSLGALHLDAATGQPQIDIAGVEAALIADAAASAVALSLTGSVDALTVGQGAYAPSEWALDLDEVDAAALADLRARLGAVDRTALTASQQGMVTGQLLLAALPKLLAGTPRMRISTLSVSTPQGEIAATAELRMAPAASAAGSGVTGSPPSSLDPRLVPTLLGRLSGSASVSAPQALVVALVARQQTRRVRRELALRGESADTLPQGLAADVEAAAQAATAALLREGWLTAEQGRLVAELRLAGGDLQVNGKPVALPDSLGSPFDP
jgi:hypothetical protein